MRSLLDGHDELFVVPSETHFFQYTGHWVDYRLRRTFPKKLDKKAQIDSLTNYIIEENLNDDPYGAVRINGKYDINRFSSYLDFSTTVDLRSLFEAYVEALYFSLTGKQLPAAKRVVEKSVENAEFAFLLRHLFPACRFIHIVRNPYASLVAIRKSRSDQGYPFIRNAILSLYNSYYNLFKNITVLDKYLVIRFEDLVSSTKETMKKVAGFVDISYQDEVLQPTMLGQPWLGNSTSNKEFSGVSKEPLEKWKNLIEDFEIILVNRMLRHVLNEYGYQKLSPRHHWIRQKLFPIEGESFKTYVKNRAFLWCM